MKGLATHVSLVRQLERERRGPELHPIAELAINAALVFGIYLAESALLRIVGR